MSDPPDHVEVEEIRKALAAAVRPRRHDDGRLREVEEDGMTYWVNEQGYPQMLCPTESVEKLKRYLGLDSLLEVIDDE